MTSEPFEADHVFLVGQKEYEDDDEVLAALKDLNEISLPEFFSQSVTNLKSDDPDDLGLRFRDEENRHSMGFEPGEEDGQLYLHAYFAGDSLAQMADTFEDVMSVLESVELVDFHIGFELEQQFANLPLPIDHEADHTVTGIQFKHEEMKLTFQSQDGSTAVIADASGFSIDESDAGHFLNDYEAQSREFIERILS